MHNVVVDIFLLSWRIKCCLIMNDTGKKADQHTNAITYIFFDGSINSLSKMVFCWELQGYILDYHVRKIKLCVFLLN